MVHEIKLTDFKEYDVNSCYNVQAFGANKNGETFSITISNFKPYFYIRVGDDWTDEDKDLFIEEIPVVGDCDKTEYFIERILPSISGSFTQKGKLYGFDTGIQYNFIKLEFDTIYAFKQTRKLWYKKDKLTKIPFRGCQTEIYESKLPPLLRIFHDYGISPCGWISIDESKTRYSSLRTECDNTFSVNIDDIEPIVKEDIVPFKICSFDGEMQSSHGDFPQPIKTYYKVAYDIMMICKDRPETIPYEFVRDLILEGFQETNENSNFPPIYAKDKDQFPMDYFIGQLDKVFNKDVKGLVKQHQTKVDDFYEYIDTDKPQKKYSKVIKFKKGTTLMKIINDATLDIEIKIETIQQEMDNNLPKIEGDIVTFIGSTFQYYGETECYKQNCIVLGDCSPIPNVEIECAENEKDVLLKWRDLIIREDPDIIIGYNIFGFDYTFIADRANELEIFDEFLKMSRNKGHKCFTEFKNYDNSKEKKITKQKNKKRIKETKIVLASGEHQLKYVEMPGRNSIDLYNYFRKEVNLDSYKLDHVAQHYIGDIIIRPFKYTKTTTTFKTKNVFGLEVGNYICFQSINHSNDDINNGAKYIVTKLKDNTITIKGRLTVEDGLKIRWGLAKDDVTPQDIFRLTDTGRPEDKAIVAKYCIQDCRLVHHLFNKLDILTGFMEMANICSVPLSYIVMRGQGIKLFSFLANECKKVDILIPDLSPLKGNEGYEGAVVLPPKCDLYLEDPVAVVDYSSLYPSSEISENISHDSKVLVVEYDLEGNEIYRSGDEKYNNLPGYKYVDIEFATYRYKKNANGTTEKVKTGRKIARYAQFPDGKYGVMPSVLKKLLKARKSTRNFIKFKTVTLNDESIIKGIVKDKGDYIIIDGKTIQKEDIKDIEDTYNDFMKNILDKRQLAYKITANSLYGGTGAKTSPFYEMDVAASTTAVGRTLLLYAKDIVENVYGNRVCMTKKYGEVRTRAQYIYGDTDSVFFCFYLEELDGTKIKGKKALEITIELAQEYGKLATKFLKDPHDLEYEKTFYPFCLLSKKRYVGSLYEEDVNKCYRKSMGIVLKRRDNAPVVKDIYGGIIDILMEQQDMSAAVKFAKDMIKELLMGRINEKKLLITKSLRGNYKNPDGIAHAVLAKRIKIRDPGNDIKPGSRIGYMYITAPKKVKQGERIETPEFIKENSLEIDYKFYLEHQVMKPILQLFGLVLEKIPEFKRKLKDFQRKKKTLQQTCDTEEMFTKKIEKIIHKEVETILCKTLITQAENKKNNQRDISSFF